MWSAYPGKDSDENWLDRLPGDLTGRFNKLTDATALPEHRQLAMGASPERRMENDGHFGEPGATGNTQYLPFERETAVAFHFSFPLQAKDDVEIDFGWQRAQMTPSFPHRPLPPLVGPFVGFRVNMALVEKSDFVVKNFVGRSEIPDAIPFTQQRNPPLQIIKPLFHFAFGLGMGFPGQTRINLQVVKRSGELRVDVGIGAEDLSVVGVVSRRAPIGFNGVADNA